MGEYRGRDLFRGITWLFRCYEGVYINQGEKLPENIPWKFIAQMLLVAAYYE